MKSRPARALAESGKAARATEGYVSYQLVIDVERPLHLQVGRLGKFDVAPGRYVYTGSARRAFEARIARHLRADKPLRWHIDYLLTSRGVHIAQVRRSHQAECELQQATRGIATMPGFGASDCRSGCGSHLKRIGA